MKAFVAFCKKEFVESLRTYRLIIVLVAFVLFGLMNPLIAKLLPEMLSGNEVGGVVITIPEATAMDSWVQFFSNNAQLGVLVLVIVFCGITASEFSRGTLINILTKGLPRRTVIVAKFLVAAAIWTLSYLLMFAVTYAYTCYFWGSSDLPHAFLAFVCPWAYGLLLLALLVLGGICFKNFYGSLLITGSAIIVMSLLNLVPKAQAYNPISLSGDAVYLLMETKEPADFIPALILCLALTLGLVIGAIAVFNRKQV